MAVPTLPPGWGSLMGMGREWKGKEFAHAEDCDGFDLHTIRHAARG